MLQTAHACTAKKTTISTRTILLSQGCTRNVSYKKKAASEKTYRPPTCAAWFVHALRGTDAVRLNSANTSDRERRLPGTEAANLQQ